MKNKHYRKAGIKLVAAIYFVVAIIALAVLIVFVGYHLFRRNVKENYEKYTKTVLNNAYSITEEYDFGDMISNREMSDGYETMREHLNKVKENSDIEYLYAIYFDDINDIHSLTYAINTKTSEELQNGGTYTYLGTPAKREALRMRLFASFRVPCKTDKKNAAYLKDILPSMGSC